MTLPDTHVNGLIDQLERQVLPVLAGRMLHLDLSATQRDAEAMAKAQAVGLGVGAAGGFIAACALAHGMAVATRDTVLLKAMGATVIAPWAQTPA